MSLHHRRFLILSSTGVLTLLLLQGVYGADDVIEMRAVVGGSVVLPSEYQRNNVKFAEWLFSSNGTKKIIAGFDGSDVGVHFKSQFTGRLEMNSNNLSLTVKKLTKADSGLFSRIYISKGGGQLKTKMIQLQVYDPTLTVNITKNVTVHQLNNTCTVSLLCNASGPPDVQFSWSGHCRGSGAKLHFSLSPAEGSVTCTCTASEANNQKLVDATIKCDNKTSNNSVKPDVNNTIPPPERYLYFVAIPAAGGVLIIVSITVGVCCYKRHKADSSKQDTVYADVLADQKKNTEKSRSTSVQYDMTIYESVDERAIGRQNNPQTVYDKVNFSRTEVKKDVGATLSSPYQEVL
ncbi:signaling lymphocytic activation molecule [Alosa sapidissima]|uniref:signaling lymphocytic activation molecule n=1 Tax=Alosa sapidissima TaxID=34773 RepID=UPI001C0856D3|nr:signaling lymphocytic activation molecule [Alosa sapidissima]